MRKNGFILCGHAALFLGASLFVSRAAAEETIVVTAPMDISSADLPLTATTLGNDALAAKRAQTSDTASLFDGIAGVGIAQGGGVSGLPAIHGLGNARVNLQVDGMTVSVACPNDMNTPLSYIDPSNVAAAVVVAGITPVSMGGDSISGTIAVRSPDPVFASGSGVAASGQISAFYRSNGAGAGGALRASVASENFSIGYAASIAAADDYEGGGHDGVVLSSEYQSENHQLTLAARDGKNLFVLEAGQQYIPRQGYPNQYMDMAFNRGAHVNGRYEGMFSWGVLEAQAYWQSVRHEMNFLTDKREAMDAMGGMGIMAGMGDDMPLDTTSQTLGYALKAVIVLGERDTLRIGNEFVGMRLDDRWPAVPGSMMLGPDAFINIGNGRRDRLGTYGEWERKWSGAWSSQLGLRNDIVWMNTGDVQPYSMMSMDDAMAADAFNAAPHARSDSTIGVTALLRYAPDAGGTYEFGYARKTRAPTLYERYAWAVGSMTSTMISWFGDGNGYVGNLDLKPETADTVSATARWQGGGDMPWNIRITPYYTAIENYIGVARLQNFTDMMGMPTPFVQLQFVNHHAELYGADLAGALKLWSAPGYGTFGLTLAAGWAHGEDTTAHTDLYHFMPANAAITLTHSLGAWQGAAEIRLVGRKSQVDALRNEPVTPAYALLDLRASYGWRQFRLDAGIDNVFDTAYAPPLGGVSLGDYAATGILRPVPGMGRSLHVALTENL